MLLKFTEKHLEPCQTSKMELLWKLKILDLFTKAPSYMFDSVMSTLLIYLNNLKKLSFDF